MVKFTQNIGITKKPGYKRRNPKRTCRKTEDEIKLVVVPPDMYFYRKPMKTIGKSLASYKWTQEKKKFAAQVDKYFDEVKLQAEKVKKAKNIRD